MSAKGLRFEPRYEIGSVGFQSDISSARKGPKDCAHVWHRTICLLPTLRPEVRKAPSPVPSGGTRPVRQAQGRLLGAVRLFFNYTWGVKEFAVEKGGGSVVCMA